MYLESGLNPETYQSQRTLLKLRVGWASSGQPGSRLRGGSAHAQREALMAATADRPPFPSELERATALRSATHRQAGARAPKPSGLSRDSQKRARTTSPGPPTRGAETGEGRGAGRAAAAWGAAAAPPPPPQRVPGPFAARFSLCRPAEAHRPGAGRRWRAGRPAAAAAGRDGRGRTPTPAVTSGPLERRHRAPRASRCDWWRRGRAGLERDQSIAAAGGGGGVSRRDGSAQPPPLPRSRARALWPGRYQGPRAPRQDPAGCPPHCLTAAAEAWRRRRRRAPCGGVARSPKAGGTQTPGGPHGPSVLAGTGGGFRSGVWAGRPPAPGREEGWGRGSWRRGKRAKFPVVGRSGAGAPRGLHGNWRAAAAARAAPTCSGEEKRLRRRRHPLPRAPGPLPGGGAGRAGPAARFPPGGREGGLSGLPGGRVREGGRRGKAGRAGGGCQRPGRGVLRGRARAAAASRSKSKWRPVRVCVCVWQVWAPSAAPRPGRPPPPFACPPGKMPGVLPSDSTGPARGSPSKKNRLSLKLFQKKEAKRALDFTESQENEQKSSEFRGSEMYVRLSLWISVSGCAVKVAQQLSGAVWCNG